MALQVQVKSIDKDKWEIVLKGEADIYEMQILKEGVQQVLDAKAKEVIMDCSELTYVDSMCLGMFISLLKKQREYGGKVKLLSLQPNVQKIFTLTGLDKVFELAG